VHATSIINQHATSVLAIVATLSLGL